MDEQTSDFFNPPAAEDNGAAFAPPEDPFGGGGAGFAAPPPPAEGFESFITATDGAAPPTPGGESFVGDVTAFAAPSATDAPPFAAPPPPAEGDFFAEPAPSADSDAPIVLAPVDYAPPPAAGLVEDVVEDDEDEQLERPAPLVVEPTPMSKWNDEWQKTLLQRKDDENALKASMVEAARAEVAKFQEERERRREARMARNRSDEQNKLEAIEADLENDNSWQRAVKMVELNQDGAEGAGDTSRMRDVLVLLKNDLTRAEVLVLLKNDL